MKRKYAVVLIAASIFAAKHSLADTHYVDVNNPTPVAPYTNWTSAATSIQDAVDAASDGDTVMVADGIYLLSSEISVSTDILLKSVNGPDVTIIDGQGGTNRCLNLGSSACTISGFTITGGKTSPLYGAEHDGGGIICIDTTPVVTNCTINGNIANNGSGGGMYYGTASDCTITGNTSHYSGGGTCRTIAYDCLIDGNAATNGSGGGMWSGEAYNCVISGNTTTKNGGGMYGGTANNCIISNNTAYADHYTGGNQLFGGGVYQTTVSNCKITDNTAEVFGGGMAYSTANNCVISGNTAARGGGMESSTANNCTITGNAVIGNGGGMSSGSTANNCIIYYNTAGGTGNDIDDYYYTARNTCASDIAHGVDGNITNAPLFVDKAGGNFRLQGGSPCIDAGSNTYVVGTTDLDGNPRIVNGVVDMGAYEYFVPMPEIAVSGPAGSLSDGGNASFGNQAVGISKVITFVISNEASDDLTGLGISKDGADASAFEAGPLEVASLGAYGSTTFRVTYTPPDAGSHTAAVHIASNDPDENPFDITLTGTGLANSDADMGSDAWETANGFDPNVDGDVATLDSDGDGVIDLIEIFQGTDRYGSAPAAAAFAPMAMSESIGDGLPLFDPIWVDSNGVFRVQYRHSTTQTAVNAQSVWLPDLMGSNWLYSGESSGGTAVTISETVVSNGPSYEIIEAASEVVSGETDALFYTLEFTPNE
jgi:parallel beta-helix repeat protein